MQELKLRIALPPCSPIAPIFFKHTIPRKSERSEQQQVTHPYDELTQLNHTLKHGIHGGGDAASTGQSARPGAATAAAATAAMARPPAPQRGAAPRRRLYQRRRDGMHLSSADSDKKK